MAPNKTVFWKVDAQADFMLPGGKLYVPRAEKIIPHIQRLVNAASEAGVFIVSSGDAHDENDPEFQRFPRHCVKGTPGAQIIPEGLTKDVVRIGNNPAEQLPGDLFAHSQVVIEKQSLDVFDNTHTGEIVDRLGDAEYIVFGVVTEYCVRSAAQGLLERGRTVSIVKDAVEALKPEEGARAIEELQRLGARIIDTNEALQKISARAGR
jgi:nicotinamidase/pyrazinamidase